MEIFVKKITLAVFLVAASISLFAGLRIFWINQPQSYISATETGLSCSRTNYSAYVGIMLEIGDTTISMQPSSGSREQQQTMIRAFDKLQFPSNRTVVIAGHYPTGKLFSQLCTEEKCTIEEVAAPQTACLTEFWNDCPYLAIRFRETSYCLLQPAES